MVGDGSTGLRRLETKQLKTSGAPFDDRVGRSTDVIYSVSGEAHDFGDDKVRGGEGGRREENQRNSETTPGL